MSWNPKEVWLGLEKKSNNLRFLKIVTMIFSPLGLNRYEFNKNFCRLNQVKINKFESTRRKTYLRLTKSISICMHRCIESIHREKGTCDVFNLIWYSVLGKRV